MKKKYPAVSHSTLQNTTLPTPLFQFLSKKTARFLLFTILFTATVSAQSNEGTPQIREVNSYISSLRALEQNTTSTYSNAQKLEDLLYNLQPSIYFYSGEVKTYGEKPNTLYTDLNSIQDADNPSILKENIEIVNLKIINTNGKIDLSKFSNYNNLKYIYIVSKINLTDQNVINMIHKYNEKYIVLYKILKEE